MLSIDNLLHSLSPTLIFILRDSSASAFKASLATFVLDHMVAQPPRILARAVARLVVVVRWVSAEAQDPYRPLFPVAPQQPALPRAEILAPPTRPHCHPQWVCRPPLQGRAEEAAHFLLVLWVCRPPLPGRVEEAYLRVPWVCPRHSRANCYELAQFKLSLVRLLASRPVR